MELKDLLKIEKPTLDEYQQTVECLDAIIKDAQAVIAQLDVETREQSAARLVGEDKDEEARNASKIKAQGRIDDAMHTRTQIFARMAAEEARIEKEKDDAAWKKVDESLRQRREAMVKVQELIDEAGALFFQVLEHGSDAIQSSPVRPALAHTPYARNEHIGLAVLERFHRHIGLPLRHTHIMIEQLPNYMCRDGLTECLQPTERAILANRI